MARESNGTALLAALATIIVPRRVELLAREFGVVERSRKVDATALVWTLVLAFESATGRTIESMRQAYEKATGRSLVRSSFYDRLTPRLAKLLRRLALDALERVGGAARVPEGYLAGFRDLLAMDATVLRLRDCLANSYAACRTNHTKAAAKLHMVMSVAGGTPCKVKLTSERVHDTVPWKRVGQWVRDRLLLFDLGYYSFHLFDRIDQNGGFFLSRLKANANPRIVDTNRKWRGRAVDVVGDKLQDVLPRLQRQVLDVMVQVRFRRRVYRGKHSYKTRAFRVVAVYNSDARRYHCYMTNVPAERLPAEDITDVYRLRWQVEILFKSMRQHGGLGELRSTKKAVVECMVWASVLAVMASQATYRLVREQVPRRSAIPLLRWGGNFANAARDLLRALVRDATDLAGEVFEHLRRNAPDPNINRSHRALEPVFLGLHA